MNSADAEVEEAEILEAEVVGNQQPPRTGKFTGLALVLSLAALLAAAGGALFTYQTRESMSADLAVLKIALEGARNETGELSQQLRTAHTSYQAQGQQLEEQKLVLTEQQKALAAHNQSLADREAKLEQIGRAHV